MTFKKGQSGNPAGRPRSTQRFMDLRERCRAFMDAEGWELMQATARNVHSRDHHRALETIAAYAYGRPTQPVSGDPDPEAPSIQVTVTFDKPEDNPD